LYEQSTTCYTKPSSDSPLNYATRHTADDFRCHRSASLISDFLSLSSVTGSSLHEWSNLCLLFHCMA